MYYPAPNVVQATDRNYAVSLLKLTCLRSITRGNERLQSARDRSEPMKRTLMVIGVGLLLTGCSGVPLVPGI